MKSLLTLFEGFNGQSAQAFGTVLFWLLLLSPVFLAFFAWDVVYNVYQDFMETPSRHAP